MPEGRFRELIPESLVLGDSVVELLLLLEDAGWMPRKLIDGRGLRLWPDEQRSRQITIDLTYRPNQQKLDFYREHTQLELLLSDKEER